MLTTDAEPSQSDYTIVNIEDAPIMQVSFDVLSLLNKSSRVVLRAKGNSTPNAVAVANIITEKLLYGNSLVDKITLDTDGDVGIGHMISTIEIVLHKT